MKKNEYFRAALFSILIGLLAGALIIAVLGRNPLTAYYNFLQGCGLAPKGKYATGRGMVTDFLSYIDYLTPMVFAALAVAVAMKTGLFNIGVSGQMLAAGFTATVLVGYSALPAAVAKPLVLLIGLSVGAVAGGLIGVLKYRFNINEVVSTIMFNYIISYVVSFMINTRYADPVSRQSVQVGEAGRLTLQGVMIGGYKCNIPLGFFFALAAVLLVRFVLDRTVLGFELKAVGAGRKAAEYAGIRVGRSIVLSMMISGALAGLAGVTYYLGYFGSIQPKVLPGTGYDAIAVCLVGNSSPFGILLSSFFLQIIGKGATYMSSRSGLESEIASVITGIILLSTTVSMVFRTFVTGRVRKAQTVQTEGGDRDA